MAKILGIGASFRNVINKSLRTSLIKDIYNIDSKSEIINFTKLLSQYISNNSEDKTKKILNKDYKVYSEFQTKKIRHGISNSESALIMALWEIYNFGINIDYISLKDHLKPFKKTKNMHELKNSIINSDAIIFSGPVYFGDRSSLMQELIHVILEDKELQERLQYKLFASIAVGAKRNGGQETTLIYKLLDMTSLGMLGVGNDTDTTAQYGGTVNAGTIGTAVNDEYGINTVMGVGRRLARLTNKFEIKASLNDKVKILFLVLQDKDGIGMQVVKNLVAQFSEIITPEIIDITKLNIMPCLACASCPQKVDEDNVYRCKIGDRDDFSSIHNRLLDHDLLIPVAFSPKNIENVVSNYQLFLERTRYLRRGDYVWADMLLTPFIIKEIGSHDNLYIRMITSFIRHSTVVSKPIIAYRYSGNIINFDDIVSDFKHSFIAAQKLTVARLGNIFQNYSETMYNPVGYVLNENSNYEEDLLEKRKKSLEKRRQRLKLIANQRLYLQENS